MEITSCELEGFIPFALSNIHYFKITPKNRDQVIIGTNGCGKSALMAELSCLPASHHIYLKGGKKTIELIHNGKNYRLISDFSNGNIHSFLVMEDGEWVEKNGTAGGTYTVQKELCKKYFKYTEEIHDLLIGKKGLSTLNTAERRELITAMSGSDLDLALGIFKQFKTKARDYIGVTKHLNNRLTTESAKILPPERISELEATVKQTTDELNAMLLEMEPNLPSNKEVKREIDSLMVTITQISKHALRIPLVRPVGFDSEPWQSIEDVSIALNHAKQEHAVNESQLNGFKEDFREITDIVEALSRSDSSGVEELQEKVRALEAKKIDLLGSIQKYHIAALTKQACDETISVEDPLREIVLEIPENNEGELNRTRLQLDKDEMEVCYNSKLKAEVLLERVLEKIEHMKDASTTNCPQCGYVWRPGVSDKELEDLKTKSKNIQSHITKMESSINDKKTYVDRVEHFHYQLNRLQRLMDQYPRLKSFWHDVGREGWPTKSPRRILLAFETWKKDIWLSCELEEIQKVIDDYSQAITSASHLKKGDQGHFSQRLEVLNTRIEEHTEKSILLRLKVQEISGYMKRVGEFYKYTDEMKSMVLKLRGKADLMVKTIKSNILSETITDHQAVLGEVKSVLISAYISNDVVRELGKDRDEAEEKHGAYQLLADELSPLDGLIAEQLSYFIGSLVGDVNKIVADVWSYDLEMQPCGLKSGELDYRFPLVVKNSEKQPPDISDGSSSQREIFDFAFMLVAMVYLELEHFPLYLDEVGKSLDEHHRVRIVRYISDIMEEGQYSQMWMISHFINGHGSFTNAEVCLIDSMNVLNLPHVFNQHVEIR